MRRTLWAAGVAVALCTAAGLGHSEDRPGRAAAEVYVIEVDGPISPAIGDFIETALERAEDDEAAALVVLLDTPGGLLNSTKTIVKDILAARVPVVVYVSPGGAGATSAGVFITLAGHVAAMAPGTTIGAAHPVSGQGGDIQGDMREKVENFAASFVESIAERRGRNVEWAVKAVRESVSITEVEAVKEKVVDFVATDMRDLLRQADGREVDVAGETRKIELSFDDAGEPRIREIEMTLRQKVLEVVADPNIAYLLMMAGVLGLYFEFANPGTVFPGVVGAICLLLALLAGQVLPISSTGVLLIMLGMAFLLAELFLPSFGVLGIGGLVALTLGSLFLYTPESQLAVDRSLVAATAAVFGVALLAIVALLVGDRRRRPMTGAEGMIGESGRTIGPVHADGKVKVHGEIWNAASREPIAADRPVRVEGITGLRLQVREQKEVP